MLLGYPNPIPTNPTIPRFQYSIFRIRAIGVLRPPHRIAEQAGIRRGDRELATTAGIGNRNDGRGDGHRQLQGRQRPIRPSAGRRRDPAGGVPHPRRVSGTRHHRSTRRRGGILRSRRSLSTPKSMIKSSSRSGRTTSASTPTGRAAPADSMST